MKRFVVELEPGVYLADWAGDPGRTETLWGAKIFVSEGAANRAIRDARSYRPFKGARVIELVNGVVPKS